MNVKSNQSRYKKVQHFADLTKMFLQIGDMKRAKKCLQIADNYFVHGNEVMKNMISNIYLYSVSGFMEMHDFSINEILPENLKNEYYKQVNTSGI
jgi:hypothetical protein